MSRSFHRPSPNSSRCCEHVCRAALREVRLFGSAARGDMWPEGHPLHSDFDLAVVTDEPIDGALAEELVNATYPLFLACGRQISPQWRTTAWMEAPPDDKASISSSGYGSRSAGLSSLCGLARSAANPANNLGCSPDHQRDTLLQVVRSPHGAANSSHVTVFGCR